MEAKEKALIKAHNRPHYDNYKGFRRYAEEELLEIWEIGVQLTEVARTAGANVWKHSNPSMIKAVLIAYEAMLGPEHIGLDPGA